MILGKKIKLMRINEGMTQKKLAEMLDIPKVSLVNYETGYRSVNEQNLLKIVNHPNLNKYALWLISDTFSIKEQIEPEHTDVNLDDF